MSNEETTITLSSYAAVLAGLGAGLALQRALALAEVAPAAWERAAEHWQAEIDESAAGDLTLLVAFDAALLSAKRRFDPSIEPIESDPRAWAQFRRHFVTAVDPVAFLTERGLALSTYARVEADWANRILADEALAAEVQKHLESPLEECPALTLVPSPLLAADSATGPVEPKVLDGSVSATPPAAAAPSPPRPAFVPGPQPAVELTPSGLPREPVLTLAEPPKPQRVSAPLGGTVEGVLSPFATALPFGATPAATAAPAMLPTGPATPASAPLGGTVEGVLSPFATALPFQAAPGAAAPATPPRGAARTPPQDGRRLSLEQFASLAAELSINPAAAVAVRARWGFSESEHLAEARAWRQCFDDDRALFEKWKQLTESYRARAAEPAAADALPFARAVPVAVAFENARKHAEEVQRPASSPPAGSLGETVCAPNPGAATSNVLPFGAEAPAASSSPPPANLPEFTVQQYASLRVELALYPHRVPYTLARYRVPPEARRQLDAHWQARLAADAALREAYSQAFATYQASLAGAGAAGKLHDTPAPPAPPKRQG